MKRILQQYTLSLALITALVFSIGTAQAQTLAGFNFNGSTNWGTSPFASTTPVTNVLSASIERVGAISTALTPSNTSTSGRWGGRSFAGTTTEPTTNLRYFAISLQPSPGNFLHLDSISSIRLLMSGRSPEYFAIKYSLDNGATFTSIITHQLSPKPGATSNQVIPKTDLTGISALWNVSGKVIFMILPYNGSNTAGDEFNYIQFGNFAGSTGVTSAATSGDAIAVRGTVNTTLPVKLSSFTSSIQNQAALLNWATESEVNFDYFVIEKRDNNSEFKEIGRVPAKGGNTKTLYNFSDRNISFETSYYRLKMVDKDGTFEYSDVVAATIASQNSLSVYPNPINNSSTLKVQFKELAAASTLRLIDITGRTVKTLSLQKGVNQASIDANNMDKGQYTLLLETGNKVLDYIKIIR